VAAAATGAAGSAPAPSGRVSSARRGPFDRAGGPAVGAAEGDGVGRSVNVRADRRGPRGDDGRDGRRRGRSSDDGADGAPAAPRTVRGGTHRGAP